MRKKEEDSIWKGFDFHGSNIRRKKHYVRNLSFERFHTICGFFIEDSKSIRFGRLFQSTIERTEYDRVIG